MNFSLFFSLRTAEQYQIIVKYVLKAPPTPTKQFIEGKQKGSRRLRMKLCFYRHSSSNVKVFFSFPRGFSPCAGSSGTNSYCNNHKT
jgi:hypothetical protein